MYNAVVPTIMLSIKKKKKGNVQRVTVEAVTKNLSLFFFYQVQTRY